MAQKADEYGSRPCLFEVKKTGTVHIIENGTNRILLGREVI